MPFVFVFYMFQLSDSFLFFSWSVMLRFQFEYSFIALLNTFRTEYWSCLKRLNLIIPETDSDPSLMDVVHPIYKQKFCFSNLQDIRKVNCIDNISILFCFLYVWGFAMKPDVVQYYSTFHILAIKLRIY